MFEKCNLDIRTSTQGILTRELLTLVFLSLEHFPQIVFNSGHVIRRILPTEYLSQDFLVVGILTLGNFDSRNFDPWTFDS